MTVAAGVVSGVGASVGASVGADVATGRWISQDTKTARRYRVNTLAQKLALAPPLGLDVAF